MTTQQNPDSTPPTPEITATPSTPETPAPEPAVPEPVASQSVAPQPTAPPPAGPKPVKKKSSGGKIFLVVALFLIVILAAAAGGGWYYLKHHVVVIAHHTLTLMTPDQIAAQSPDQNASQPTDETSTQTSAQPQASALAPDQSQQSPTATTPPTPPAVTSKKSAAGNKKSPSQLSSATSATANNQSAPATPNVDRPVAQPRVPTVSFDPFKLDPETNSRLKIDPSKFPAGLTFTVFIDGQILYTGNTSNRADFDKFVIPPGVHQMQLTVSSGNVSLTSNIVSAEFVVKKHLTFKVEFRVANTPPQSNAPAFDPNAQLIAKLKTDFWHM